MATTKTIRMEHDLIYVILLSLLLALLIALGDISPVHYARIVIGLPFILFFPGYTLIAALFPKQADLDGIERTALSFGLSIAVAPLIGLGLNYTPWGIRLAPILISLILFILVMSGIALYRRRTMPPEERFIPRFQFTLPAFGEMSKIDRALSIALILAILFAIGSICYVIAVPKTGETFTEFYILGPGGKAEGYPADLAVGEQGQAIVGVVNHEYTTVNYTIQIKMGNVAQSAPQPIALDNGQKYEAPMMFSAATPGPDQKVEFLLFREGDAVPYRSLHLRVNVHAAAGSGADSAESVAGSVY